MFLEEFNLVDRGPTVYDLRFRERFVEADCKANQRRQKEVETLMTKQERNQAKISAIDDFIKKETDAILIYEQESLHQEMNSLVESLEHHFGCRFDDRNKVSVSAFAFNFSQLRMLADLFRFTQQAVVAIMMNSDFKQLEPSLVKSNFMLNRDEVQFIEVNSQEMEQEN